ncbi:MAG: hypothetical protein QM619_16240 [Micropruina sp.]|uniref:hypothetical protein n=1 Tax=Micropruina sp. TaxID=2737536 RepID=UPI0039E2D95A
MVIKRIDSTIRSYVVQKMDAQTKTVQLTPSQIAHAERATNTRTDGTTHGDLRG